MGAYALFGAIEQGQQLDKALGEQNSQAMDHVRKEMAQLERESSHCRQKLSTCSTNLDAKQQEIDHGRKEKQRLQQEGLSCNQQLSVCNSDRDNIQKEVARITTLLNESMSKIQNLEATNKQEREVLIEKMTKKISTLSEISQLKGIEIGKFKEAYNKSLQALHTAEVQLKKLPQQELLLQQTRQELENCRAEVSNCQADVSDYQSTILNLQTEIDNADVFYDATDQTAQPLSTSTQAMGNELNEMRFHLQNLRDVSMLLGNTDRSLEQAGTETFFAGQMMRLRRRRTPKMWQGSRRKSKCRRSSGRR